jgi:hypothetical protein
LYVVLGRLGWKLGRRIRERLVHGSWRHLLRVSAAAGWNSGGWATAMANNCPTVVEHQRGVLLPND